MKKSILFLQIALTISCIGNIALLAGSAYGVSMASEFLSCLIAALCATCFTLIAYGCTARAIWYEKMEGYEPEMP